MLGILCAVLFGLTADTDNAAKLSQEGWDLWKTQQYDAAIEKFDQAVKLDAKNVNALNGLGWSQLNSGKVDQAETSFKKTLELEPTYPAALNGSANCIRIRRSTIWRKSIWRKRHRRRLPPGMDWHVCICSRVNTTSCEMGSESGRLWRG